MGRIRGEPNPKSEIRNPKQIRITEIRMLETSERRQLECWHSSSLEHSNFEFVSDFDIRISSFDGPNRGPLTPDPFPLPLTPDRLPSILPARQL